LWFQVVHGNGLNEKRLDKLRQPHYYDNKVIFRLKACFWSARVQWQKFSKKLKVFIGGLYKII